VTELADTDIGEKSGLIFVPMVHKLSCLYQVQDGVVDIGQLAEALEATQLADTEIDEIRRLVLVPNIRELNCL